jgi:streptogramin lyase
MNKRQFLAAGATAAAGLVLSGSAIPVVAQQAAGGSGRAAQSVRQVKTTPVFKCPRGFPNGMAASPEGLWVGEQKLTGDQAARYGVPVPDDLLENAWLLDWNTGEVLKTIRTECRNTSGMAYGEGYIWMVANAAPNGVFQTDMNSRTVSHRQIPLGGGGNHGAKFRHGKLWVVSTRLHAMMRIDPNTWQPEFLIPYNPAKRHHDMAFDAEGNIWLITGENSSTRWAEATFGLDKYNAETGELLESVEFVSGSADPHGLEIYDGVMYTCDAGIHPNWPTNDSPHAGFVLRIDFV